MTYQTFNNPPIRESLDSRCYLFLDRQSNTVCFTLPCFCTALALSVTLMTMTTFRSLPLAARLFALLTLLLATSTADRHDKAWNILDEVKEAPSYLSNFFATESYHASGTEPSFLVAESRYLQIVSPTASDDDSSSKKKSSSSSGVSISAGGGGASIETDDSTETTTSLVSSDDGAYPNQTAILPPEEDQPSTWPATVMVLFVVVAAVLLVLTAYRNCRKRSQYQYVSTTSLTV